MDTFGIKDASYFEDSFGFVAKSHNEVIGQYLFKTDETPPLLDHFFLETQHIGQGYGRRLWNHCVSTACTKGWKEFLF
ncbi:GNAT family N-acetyltransferase [Candidatus Bealeia paramacronuclearis]|uniref:GNAT family N-acetyltransferase n=2 Tax=Candidatus Bealeia paramacronuclearis TaxID=1921001 RepID=A0ABZ2C4V8_9PROT|nr:GNAT family N-acetyltransferase [Candidatus Bealeia paramacronuclearis]